MMGSESIFQKGDYILFESYTDALNYVKKAPNKATAEKTVSVVIEIYQKIFAFYEQIYPKEVLKFKKEFQNKSFIEQGFEFLDRIDQDPQAKELFIQIFHSLDTLFQETLQEIDKLLHPIKETEIELDEVKFEAIHEDKTDLVDHLFKPILKRSKKRKVWKVIMTIDAMMGEGDYILFRNYAEAMTFEKEFFDMALGQKHVSCVIKVYQKVLRFFQNHFYVENEAFLKKYQNLSLFEKGYKVFEIISQNVWKRRAFIHEFISVQNIYDRALEEYDSLQKEEMRIVKIESMCMCPVNVELVGDSYQSNLL